MMYCVLEMNAALENVAGLDMAIFLTATIMLLPSVKVRLITERG